MIQKPFFDSVTPVQSQLDLDLGLLWVKVWV